jgi:hypothetical protein
VSAEEATEELRVRVPRRRSSGGTNNTRAGPQAFERTGERVYVVGKRQRIHAVTMDNVSLLKECGKVLTCVPRRLDHARETPRHRGAVVMHVGGVPLHPSFNQGSNMTQQPLTADPSARHSLIRDKGLRASATPPLVPPLYPRSDAERALYRSMQERSLSHSN